jgi:HPt (histidine-containing phosphotransfer) domain-containing protein
MVDSLGVAFANRDLEAIKSISHDIKGTAGMYGFRQISDSAAAIEAAAREESFSLVNSRLEQLYQLHKEANSQVG